MPRSRGLLPFIRPLHWLARQLHHQPLGFLAVLTIGTILLGATGFFITEHNGTVRSFWDALFLAGASATTSETYDQVPQHGISKVITVLLGFAGITLSGCFVAAVTAIIIQGPEPEYERQEYSTLVDRLDRIERCVTKLDRRTRRQRQRPAE
jgi:hypothetical protein